MRKVDIPSPPSTTLSPSPNTSSASTVYDAFSGCGGNTIAFARQDHIGVVISNELNHTRSNMCQHNAKLYGITDTVTFTSHDALQYFPEAPFVFVDPPWAWGQERLQECWQTFKSHYPHGMMKIPVDFPVPIGTKIRLSPPTTTSHPSWCSYGNHRHPHTSRMLR